MTRYVTNVHLYLSIAEDALEESTRLLAAGRTQKPHGQRGYVNTYDPERRSFKQSFIAIVFAGMYIEASLALVGRERLGPDGYLKIDRRTWEAKLEALGASEPGLLARCARFRQARNDLVHEKALDLDAPLTPSEPLLIAQDEAVLGVELARDIGKKLGVRRTRGGRVA